VLITKNNPANRQQSIDEALREQCNIPVKSYFLAVVTDDGRALQFSGPDNIPQHDSEIQQFFSLPQYIQYNKSRGIAGTLASLTTCDMDPSIH
jgi:hypothetical protein